MEHPQPRYLETPILRDLEERKMVFLAGPRQVGKTTFVRAIGADRFRNAVYRNWDYRPDRQAILAHQLDPNADLLIFDELHKYRQWKRFLKGLYDTHRDRYRILVTGSARLDLYRRGGDSLQGRYHHYRLHPFSLAEVLRTSHHALPHEDLDPPHVGRDAAEAYAALEAFGGFPEPFFAQSARTLRRWQSERLDRLIREDIRDIEAIRDLSALQVLVELLPEKVGSLLSLNALREDLEVAHKTIALWVDILERFYYLFRVHPYAARTVRSIRKQPKAYLWDWSEVQDPGARFENLIASHLLKFAHVLHDVEGYHVECSFLRDADGREVDFLITVDRKPWFAVEVKRSATQPDPSLRYFGERLRIPYRYQVVRQSGIDVLQDGVRIVSADRFLAGLV